MNKGLACIAFVFNTMLFGTYYAISKEALGRIDPILFTFFEMMCLVPAALCILFCTRRQITRAVLKRGVLLGSSLCLALFTISIALKYTTATGTAFFPSLNGFLAAFLAWMLLRHPIMKASWIAGVISVIGTVLLIANASMGGLRGSLIAFLGGLFFTGYVFLSDGGPKDEQAPWALFGIELLTMALWAGLIVLLFSDWDAFHPQLPRDIWVILYVAGACTFLPTMITVLLQKYVSPVTVSFLYILEPVFGAIVAAFYLHEALTPGGYLGGGLIVLGAIIHTWGSARASSPFRRPALARLLRPFWLTTLLQQARRAPLVILSVVLPQEHLLQAECFSSPWFWIRTEDAFLDDRKQWKTPPHHLMSKGTMNMADSLLTSHEAQVQSSLSSYNLHDTSIMEQPQDSVHMTGDGETPSPQEHPTRVSHHSETPLPETYIPPRQRSAIRRISLLAAMASLVIVTIVVLLPALSSAQPTLTDTMTAAPVVATVGDMTFSSSGQLDSTGSQGLNDIISASVPHLSMPAREQSYYAWLLPDATDHQTKPLLLGKLGRTGSQAQLIYQQPGHENLLALYSGFEVTEQPGTPMPTALPRDPHACRYVGRIPDTPTPGDEQHYSLLSHLRHLLAADPTLQHIGLQGGLDLWLYRNGEKILEWSSAARDSWAGGKQTALIHRQMLRVLDYLDGAAAVYNSGDLPSGSPLLVDPMMGRIGLLEVNQTQVLPAYLTHVDLHLQGLIDAPGHSQAQRQLAIKIDQAMKTVTSLLQRVRQDAARLVRMSESQLKRQDAVALLNDMVSNANAAYTGQFDPSSGGTLNGIVWIHNELQGLATMPLTTPIGN